MSEKFDILYDIDMELYTEFNDELCKINENLGSIYSYKEKEDVENAMRRKEIQLLRGAVKKLQKENEENIEALEEWINGERVSPHCIHKDKIRAKTEELNKKIKILEQSQQDGIWQTIGIKDCQEKIKLYEELLEEQDMSEDRLQEFLKELTILTEKYNIKICGCGCHASPWLEDLKSEEDIGYNLEYNKETGIYEIETRLNN